MILRFPSLDAKFQFNSSLIVQNYERLPVSYIYRFHSIVEYRKYAVNVGLIGRRAFLKLYLFKFFAIVPHLIIAEYLHYTNLI